MEITDFEQKIFEKIKDEKITPKPRWHFLLKNYVVWSVGTLALLIGSAAVSVMIYLFKYNNWEIHEQTHKSLLEFFLLTLPYFWIIFLGLFVFILYYNLQHTKTGYRYPVWFIVTTAILSSVILGSLFFLAGFGEKIDNVLGERAPLYQLVFNRHLDFWFNPAEGRLTGIVTAKDEDQKFEIRDPRGDDWLVTIASPDDLSIRLIKINQPVDLIGQALNDNQFQAEVIRPVRPGRGFLSQPRGDRPCPTGNCRLPHISPLTPLP